MHKQIQYTTRGGAINVLSPNIKKCIFYNEENFVGGVDFLDDTQITVIGL